MEPEQRDGSGFNSKRNSDTAGPIAKNNADQGGTIEPNSFALLRVQIYPRSAKLKAARAISFVFCTICTAEISLTLILAAQASPLSATSFNQLASQCAPGVKVSTLRAVASVESHFEPWALSDNNSHQTWKAQSLSAAVNLAESRIQLGHSLDLGLMQINSRNLPLLGITLSDAFDACASLGAANRILLTAMAASSTETEREAALLIALSRYNTGKPLQGIANGYSNKVIAAQDGFLDDKGSAQNKENASSQWNVWGNSDVELESWVGIAANDLSEIERAGAQSSDARSEGRAPASPVKKGEPYVLSAFQESEPRQP